MQEAVIPGLRFGQEYYNDLLATYTRKRDLFVEGLDAIGLQHTVPQGAYYILMDISEFGFDSDLEFCEVLARDVGVGAVPGSSFFREPVNHLIRFHFAKRDETLCAALNRLETIRQKNPGQKVTNLRGQFGKSEFIKENIDETVFMFALFKCRKSDKGRN